MILSSQFPISGQMNTILSVQRKNNRHGINSSLIKLRLAGASSKCGADEKEGVELGEGLEAELTPKHVAMIMDGNRRWARDKGVSVQLGHKAGGEAMNQLALNCMNHGVKVLSLFSFSTENWVRPEGEVDSLMSLFHEITASYIHDFITRDDMRISFVGDRERLSLCIQTAMNIAEESSKGNKGMHLVIALSYSGRYDIIEATKKIATKVKHGVLQVQDIDDALVGHHLETNVVDDFPNPDLLIRTSGELRISNYMLWQLAYTELFFSNKLFPDFDDKDLLEAITAFRKRQRRFGGVKHRHYH